MPIFDVSLFYFQFFWGGGGHFSISHVNFGECLILLDTQQIDVLLVFGEEFRRCHLRPKQISECPSDVIQFLGLKTIEE
jgi:hypothetical protein